MPALYEVTLVDENGLTRDKSPSSIGEQYHQPFQTELPLQSESDNPISPVSEKSLNATEREPLPPVHTERVDDIPLLFHTLEQMNVAHILNTHVSTHGNRSGLSLGGLTSVWLSYILSLADHRMCEVEQWAAKHQMTLTHLLDEPWSIKDFTDDRLAAVLRYLSDDVTWQTAEGALGQHLVRIYHLEDQLVSTVRRCQDTIIPKIEIS